MTPIHLKFNLREFEAWAKKSTGLSLETFAGDVVHFLKTMEEVPPMRLDRILRPLIIDEGVAVDDLVLTVVDEETGKEYPYNPHPALHAVFDGLAPNPPSTSSGTG